MGFTDVRGRGIGAVETAVGIGQSVRGQVVGPLEPIAEAAGGAVVVRGTAVRTDVAILVRRSVRASVTVPILVFVGRFVGQAAVATVRVPPRGQIGIVKVVTGGGPIAEVQPGRGTRRGHRRVRTVRAGRRAVRIGAPCAVRSAIAAGAQRCRRQTRGGPRQGRGPACDDRLHGAGP